ncbi:unnamed protein product [Dracunculus medinensis]|uniref:Protein NDRG3 n=1 Tax=Dracunculus medinensis TaxID=318479 RepID=A0A0N4ULF7_DRAME|nr:unnamed protein product [Dracunculus medinensis]
MEIWCTVPSFIIRPIGSLRDLQFEEKLPTAYGNVKVSIYGDRKNLPIVTFHDLGIDSETTFQNFFLFGSGGLFLEKFCIYNINAPGQEIDALSLPENYIYPSMDGLAEIVQSCIDHFGLKSFTGIGVGVGANVMLRYALKKQENVDALVLINCVGTSCGWVEWSYEKVNIKYLRSVGMTSFTIDYLMWHHFGKQTDECNNANMIRQYRTYFQRLSNPANLASFIETYINRSPLVFSRNHSNGPHLNVPVLQMVGSASGFVDDTVEVNSRLDPATSEWIKISDSCGLVLDDKPQNVTQAILLFLQGLGHLPTVNVAKAIKQISDMQKNSESDDERAFDSFAMEEICDANLPV